MNKYEFDLVLNDGHHMNFRTWAPCKLCAYDDLTTYLEDCKIDPEEVRIVDCVVNIAEGDNYGADCIS